MEKITLADGSGGRQTHELIRSLFLKKLHNPFLAELSDSAVLEYTQPLAFTTDSFVVQPLRFPGGDIGRLSVCGTVNDLAVQGAVPQYLSLAMVAEEGLALSVLEGIVSSIAAAAREARVQVVTGDFKVVGKGGCDQLFITTSGVGALIGKVRLSLRNIRPGDVLILTGGIGEHGFAVLAARYSLRFGAALKSDCAPLAGLLIPLLKRGCQVRCMRDPTRGGLATTLNELAEGASVGIELDEQSIPVAPQVRVASEMLGIDPLYAACEGRAVVIVSPRDEARVLRLLRAHALGRKARVIGRATKGNAGRVILNTVTGAQRFVEMLENDPLPRIC